MEIERQYGSSAVFEEPTLGEAVFDDVPVEAASTTPSSGDGEWRNSPAPRWSRAWGSTESDGVFTLTGSGDIGEVMRPFGDDLVQLSLGGATVGVLAAAALGALFMTAEFKRGMIRTTFAASPGRPGAGGQSDRARRGHVPSRAGRQRRRSWCPRRASDTTRTPGLPELSLANLTVLRAVIGTAVLFALVAVLSLAVATIVRHPAVAIPVVILPLLVLAIVSTGLPLSVATWLTGLPLPPGSPCSRPSSATIPPCPAGGPGRPWLRTPLSPSASRECCSAGGRMTPPPVRRLRRAIQAEWTSSGRSRARRGCWRRDAADCGGRRWRRRRSRHVAVLNAVRVLRGHHQAQPSAASGWDRRRSSCSRCRR